MRLKLKLGHHRDVIVGVDVDVVAVIVVAVVFQSLIDVVRASDLTTVGEKISHLEKNFMNEKNRSFLMDLRSVLLTSFCIFQISFYLVAIHKKPYTIFL